MGMLRLPTQRIRRVVWSCGKYWIEERTAARTPRKFAQDCREEGCFRPITKDMMRSVIACRTQRPATANAVRYVGVSSSSTAGVTSRSGDVSDVGRGK